MQISQCLIPGSLVLAVEGEQLIENRMTLTHARMAKDLPAGNHAKGDAREAQGNFHMAVPRVFS